MRVPIYVLYNIYSYTSCKYGIYFNSIKIVHQYLIVNQGTCRQQKCIQSLRISKNQEITYIGTVYILMILNC